jgi:Bacterial extracellular solute-binding protein
VSDSGDFYANLRASFTYKDQLYCLPKDFSTLALEINTDLWKKAGLTDADIPTTWDQLKAVAKKQALDLVKALTTKDAQLAAAKAFGVMPSRQSTQADYVKDFPQDKAFIEGAAYAQGPVNAPKMTPVLADFDTGLPGLPAADAATILKSLQTNASAVIGKWRRDLRGRGHPREGGPRSPRDAGAEPPARSRRSGIRGREGLAGWVFVSPMILVLGLFLVLPIFMALWVSLTDWKGREARSPMRWTSSGRRTTPIS